MTEKEVRDFLAQFDKAREDFRTWPKWMQDAAIERAATFPKSAVSGDLVPQPPYKSGVANAAWRDGFEGKPLEPIRGGLQQFWDAGKAAREASESRVSERG